MKDCRVAKVRIMVTSPRRELLLLACCSFIPCLFHAIGLRQLCFFQSFFLLVFFLKLLSFFHSWILFSLLYQLSVLLFHFEAYQDRSRLLNFPLLRLKRIDPKETFDEADPYMKQEILRLILHYLQQEGFSHAILVLGDEANMKMRENLPSLSSVISLFTILC